MIAYLMDRYWPTVYAYWPVYYWPDPSHIVLAANVGTTDKGWFKAVRRIYDRSRRR